MNKVNKFLQISITFLFLFCIANVANAAILYLEPSNASYYQNDVFMVEVRLDTEGEIINAVRASLEFPPDILRVEDFSKGNSILTLWPQEPVFGREIGLISFSGGVPGGYWGKDGLLGKIIFQAHQAPLIATQSTANIKFLEDSMVLLNDGLGTKVDLNKIGASFNILPGTGEEKNPWQEEIEKDDVLPEPFKISLSQEPSIFEGKYFITFSTVDKQTGIDHYEVFERKKDGWKIATSPYVLENQELTSDIKVKAIDKAGNYWMEVLEAQNKPKTNYLIYVGLGIILVLLIIILKKLLPFLLILILFFAIIPTTRATSASLYLSPSRGNFTVGSTFTVSVYLNTEGNEINVVQADLKFPPDKLQVTSPTTGSSFVSEWLTPPSYSNTQGLISFKGGVLGGITTSSGLVSSITFRAVSSGIARIRFLEGSRVLLNDGKGTDILTISVDGEYNIVIPPPEGPRVFSSTHPSPNIWYSDANPAFNWEEEIGVNDYSWTFDQNPKGIPDGVFEGEVTFTSFSDVNDGIWYFHLRQKRRGVWGKTSHVAVKIDVTSPNDFVPEIETYTRIVGYQTVVYFETDDNFSRMDHYEVSIIDLSASEPTPSFFTEQVSPYKVPTTKAGKYNIVVRAIDRAGNVKEKEARFRIMTPLITHIEGKGLMIKGTFLSWGVIWALIFIFIIVLGAIVYFLYRKLLKRKSKTYE